MKLSKKTEKGITLIALIITIIIMIILVVITVSIALNVGLFKKAGHAVANTDLAMQREKNLTGGSVRIGDTTYNSIDEYLATIGGGGETPLPVENGPNVVYEIPETYTYAIKVGGLNTNWEQYPYTHGDNVKMYIVPINGYEQDIYVIGTGPMRESRDWWYYTTTSEVYYEDGELQTLLYKNAYYDRDEDGGNRSWVKYLLKGTRNVYISYGVTSISDDFMNNVDDLETVYIPSSVISIGGGAFCDTENVDYINIPYGVTTIGGLAFMNCSIESITIPETVTFIGQWAFSGSDLTNVVFSDGITNIGGSRAFAQCECLESVTIPESVTYIDEYVFEECTNLTIVNYKGTEEEWHDLIYVIGSNWEDDIRIGTGNEAIINATINYNYTGE